jgi:hypothetical protein
MSYHQAHFIFLGLRVAAAYNYNPSYRDDCLRAKRISNIAARKLCQNILQKLPEEVCNIIAQYIVLELATIGLQEIISPLNPTQRTRYALDLNKDIYVAYQVIEGVYYIQWLTNKQPDNKGQLVYKANEKQNLRAIYVAFDYLGVRNVYFGNPPAVFHLGWSTTVLDQHTCQRNALNVHPRCLFSLYMPLVSDELLMFHCATGPEAKEPGNKPKHHRANSLAKPKH